MPFDLEAMLLALCDVEFILVGGVAAAVQGAPIVTQDVDILYRIEPSNLSRIKARSTAWRRWLATIRASCLSQSVISRPKVTNWR